MTLKFWFNRYIELGRPVWPFSQPLCKFQPAYLVVLNVALLYFLNSTVFSTMKSILAPPSIRAAERNITPSIYAQDVKKRKNIKLLPNT